MSQSFEFTKTNWNRRQFIQAGGAPLVSSSLYSLIGCGGSGGGSNGGGSDVQLKNFPGTIVLPPGVDPLTLAIGAGLGTDVLTDGKFTARAPSDAPSLVTAFDPSTKKVVLMGLTNLASGKVTLDATNTAIALIFFAVGGSSMSRNGMTNLANEIKTHSATATLAGVISARILVDPFAVGNGDPQIKSAVSAAANSFASGHNFPITRAQGGYNGGPSIPTLLELDPTGMVNGITYINQSKLTGFSVQNTKRRMGYVYTYLTGHINSSNVLTEVNPPVQVGSVLEVPSVTSILNGSNGWNPIESAPVALDIQGSDSKSVYNMVYLTQVFFEPEPAFFSQSRWANELTKWRGTLHDLGTDTFVGFFTNIILSAVGFAGLAWEHAQLGAFITRLQTIPSISALIESAAGESVLLGDLASATITEFLATGDIAVGVLSNMSALVATLSAEAEAFLAAGAATAIGLAAIQAAVATLLVCGAVVLSGELGAIALDTSLGERGNIATGTVIRQKLTLTPQNPTAEPGDRVKFNVKLPAGVEGTVEYDWSCDATFAVLSDNNGGHSGRSFTSPKRDVDLVTTGSDEGVITVKVTAFLVSGGGRTEIGSAQSMVTMEGGSGGGGDLGVVTITVSGDPFGGDGVYIDRDVQGGKNGNSFAMQSPSGPFPFLIGISTLNGELDGTYPLGNPSNPPSFSFRGLINHVTDGDFCTVASTVVNGHTRAQFSFQASKALGGGFVVTYSGSGTCRMNNF